MKKNIKLAFNFFIVSVLVLGTMFFVSASDSCSDSDGNDKWTFGVTSTLDVFFGIPIWNEYEDFCASSGVVYEYTCSGNNLAGQMQSCGLDSSSGPYCIEDDIYVDSIDFYCSSGKCARHNTPQLIEECENGCFNGQCLVHHDSCEDTDGGFNPEIFGTVSGYINDDDYSFNDGCPLPEPKLFEYFCLGDYRMSHFHTCENGCADGRCLPHPDSCEDTDGGFNPEVLGTVSGYVNNTYYSFSDNCPLPEPKVFEFFCLGDYRMSYFHACENACSEGVCI